MEQGILLRHFCIGTISLLIYLLIGHSNIAHDLLFKFFGILSFAAFHHQPISQLHVLPHRLLPIIVPMVFYFGGLFLYIKVCVFIAKLCVFFNKTSHCIPGLAKVIDIPFIPKEMGQGTKQVSKLTESAGIHHIPVLVADMPQIILSRRLWFGVPNWSHSDLFFRAIFPTPQTLSHFQKHVCRRLVQATLWCHN